MSSSEINESHKFTFINKLTNEFYKFVGEIYIEYMKNKIQTELLKNESETVSETEPIDVTHIILVCLWHYYGTLYY